MKKYIKASSVGSTWRKSGPNFWTLRTDRGTAEIYKAGPKSFELTVTDGNGNWLIGPTDLKNNYTSKDEAMRVAENLLN